MLDELIARIIQYPKRSALVGLAILLLAGVIGWWFLVWQNPQAVFDDMLARNLDITSVTKHVNASKGDQSIDQLIRLNLGANNATDWLVTAKQTGSTVATESIATPDTGFVRYTQISSNQKDVHGHIFNFSKALNIWGKSDGKTDTSLTTLFDQTLLDITSAPTPPIGNLPADQRNALLRYIDQEKVFAPDYKKVKRETVDGRSTYAYSVAVKMGPYVRMMKQFAQDIKLDSLKNVDPAPYDNLAPLTMNVWVDTVSHQLVELGYAPSGFAEHYSGWGLQTPIKAPTKTITATELQQRLQALGS